MISIIIPAYNPEPNLLKRCLNSIFFQEYQDYEIILVNDGSKIPDYEWFNQLEHLDSRVKVISQNNRGVSAARNTGILYAKGDYIAFVDCDDTIDSRFLSEAARLADQYNADIVIGTLQYIENGIPQTINEDDSEHVFNLDNMYELRRSHLKVKPCKVPYTVLGSPCARLIKTELLDNIRFKEEIKIYEDQIFNRELMLHAERAVYIHHVWYYYYQYDDSTYHTTLEKTGKKEMRLRLDYLAATNEINLQETNFYTKGELLRVSLRKFIAAVNYWTIQKPEKVTRKESVEKMNELYTSLLMERVVNEYKDVEMNSKADKLIYQLVKRKMFNMIYIYLRMYNLARKN